MLPIPLSFSDWLKRRDMGAIGAIPPIGTGFGFNMPTADQELMVKSGLGGGMRDSNIQDATGITGGGTPINGGAGGGMRDSNIQDTTGTTGGNAGSDSGAKGFDWKGLGDGLSQIGKGMKGMQGTAGPEMRPPAMSDDSGQRMAAASQLWQSIMQKRKMKGLL